MNGWNIQNSVPIGFSFWSHLQHPTVFHDHYTQGSIAGGTQPQGFGNQPIDFGGSQMYFAWSAFFFHTLWCYSLPFRSTRKYLRIQRIRYRMRVNRHYRPLSLSMISQLLAVNQISVVKPRSVHLCFTIKPLLEYLHDYFTTQPSITNQQLSSVEQYSPFSMSWSIMGKWVCPKPWFTPKTGAFPKN